MEKALCTQSLQLPQLLESQSFILIFRPAFMVKTKEKMAFFDSGGDVACRIK